MTTEDLAIEWPHSVKYSQGTNGVWRAEVKARGKTPEEAIDNSHYLADRAQLELGQLNAGKGE